MENQSTVGCDRLLSTLRANVSSFHAFELLKTAAQHFGLTVCLYFWPARYFRVDVRNSPLIADLQTLNLLSTFLQLICLPACTRDCWCFSSDNFWPLVMAGYLDLSERINFYSTLGHVMQLHVTGLTYSKIMIHRFHFQHDHADSSCMNFTKGHLNGFRLGQRSTTYPRIKCESKVDAGTK